MIRMPATRSINYPYTHHEMNVETYSGSIRDVRKLLAGGSSGNGSCTTGVARTGLWSGRSWARPIAPAPSWPRFVEASDRLLLRTEAKDEG